MDRPKVYIDGQEGTTGLQIYDRLAGRQDIQLLTIDPDKRKDSAQRARLMNEADLVFLCLPDQAAREAVALVTNDRTRIIDASTAHRTAPGWVYGFPELGSGQREAIACAKRVANPGCHATGFISIVAPLVQAGVLPADRDEALSSPAIYAITQAHKHLPEMQKICGLAKPPVFSPIVDDYYKGMATTVPLHLSQLRGVTGLRQVWQVYADHYGTYDGRRLVYVAGDPTDPEGGVEAGAKLYGNAKAGQDDLVLIVAGSDEAFTVTALFDNLGKGASGAAVQNMNLMLGFEETRGLNL